MNHIRAFFWGILLILADISFIPALFSYSLWTDFTFFYLLVLLLAMKEEAFPIAIVLSVFKAIFFFPEHIFAYLGIVILSLLLAYAFRKTLSLIKFSWEMLWGLGLICLEMVWLRRFTLSALVYSCLLHFLVWIFLFPFFFNYFDRKIKLQAIRKGSAV